MNNPTNNSNDIISYVSAPEYTTKNAEKEVLFYIREKDIYWTKYELEMAESDTRIFLRFGWNILEQMNFGVKMDQINTIH